MRAIAVLCLTLFAGGCGRGSLTGPSAVPQEPSEASVVKSTPSVTPPAYMDGYFSTARSSADWAPGSTQIILPTWSDPIAQAAKDMATNNSFAFVSVHHCFGPGRTDTMQCLDKTKTWMQPVVDVGRLLGIYGPDEPMGGEIKDVKRGDIDSFIAQIRSVFPGRSIMMAEVYDTYVIHYREGGRWSPAGGYFPAVDYFGLTGYYMGNPEWMMDVVRENPRINVFFASSYPAQQYDWDTLAHRAGAKGIFRWSLDLGAAMRGVR